MPGRANDAGGREGRALSPEPPGDGPAVHLFDAHVYIFRAWAVMPEMAAPDGAPTGAAYGFANTLLRYLRRGPRFAACCFDHSFRSFRNEIFPDYKISRGEEAPPDLAPQFALCRQVAEALGLAALEAPGYEADDVIATVCQRLRAGGARVVVVSADKDLCQLVAPGVHFYDLQREAVLDEGGVRARFGVAPAQIPDYLGLVGDSADDLPGVPGYGRKSAAAALCAFGAIESIPADAAEWAEAPVRGAERLARQIAAHRAQALRTRQLATLVRDVPGLPQRRSELAWRGVNRPAWRSLCQRLGWRRIAERALFAPPR